MLTVTLLSAVTVYKKERSLAVPRSLGCFMAPWLVPLSPRLLLVRDEDVKWRGAPPSIWSPWSGLVLVSNVPLKRWTVCVRPASNPSIVQRRRRRGS